VSELTLLGRWVWKLVLLKSKRSERSGGTYSNNRGTKTCSPEEPAGHSQRVTKGELEQVKGSNNKRHPATTVFCVNNPSGSHCKERCVSKKEEASVVAEASSICGSVRV
jgi:hypothetical protein